MSWNKNLEQSCVRGTGRLIVQEEAITLSAPNYKSHLRFKQRFGLEEISLDN